MAPDPTSACPDSALISRIRLGDTTAFADLWSRHAAVGYRYARSLTSAFEPDDLVAEAYLQIMRAMRNGRGPSVEFRPYLLATIRNLARTWGRSTHEIPLETLDDLEAADSDVGENVLHAMDARATAQAFRTLPPRWQRVLWLIEIEHLTPAQVARIMGMTANGVSSLAFRARDGLRDAWLQMQVAEKKQSPQYERDCAWSRAHIGSYARQHLSPRYQAKMSDHLTACAPCAAIAREALDTAATLPSSASALASTSGREPVAGSL